MRLAVALEEAARASSPHPFFLFWYSVSLLACLCFASLLFSFPARLPLCNSLIITAGDLFLESRPQSCRFGKGLKQIDKQKVFVFEAGVNEGPASWACQYALIWACFLSHPHGLAFFLLPDQKRG